MSIEFKLSTEPKIQIDLVEGNLRLVGWENEVVLVKAGNEENLTSQQDREGKLTLSCNDDLSLNVPEEAEIKILKVNGDISIHGLTGTLDLEIANSDVAIRNAGEVSIGTIESDFSLRGAKGDVRVKSVGGDASLWGVEGSIKLDSVSDDLVVLGVSGNLKVDVDDDVVVHLEPKPDQEYSVVAGDDIMLVLPEGANATLNLSGEHIVVAFPDIDLDESTSQVVTLGEGTAKINLNAGSRVLVSTADGAAKSAHEFGNFAGLMFDWESLGREIGQHWGNFGQDVEAKVAEAAERAARKAEAAARRIERHAERRAHRTVRNNVKISWAFDSSKIPRTPKPFEPVTDEERLTILNMLAEKKITSEQAEKLLTALEGGK